MKFKDINLDNIDEPWDELRGNSQTQNDMVRSSLANHLNLQDEKKRLTLKHLIDENEGNELSDDSVINLINNKSISYNDISKAQWDRIKSKIKR